MEVRRGKERASECWSRRGRSAQLPDPCTSESGLQHHPITNVASTEQLCIIVAHAILSQAAIESS